MGVKVNIIAAVADNLAIGNRGQLLWHISEDLKYFKKVTMGCPVIMGRKTFESICRPLPGRLNIVVTRNAAAQFPEGIVKAGSLEEAVEVAGKNISEKTGEDSKNGDRQNDGNMFVIGGGEIYRQAIAIADRLYITRVHASPAADTFFPEIDGETWTERTRGRTVHDTTSGLDYEFVVYERKTVF